MADFSRQIERDAMVDTQIASRGVHEPKLLTAMRRVPRHCFVPGEAQPQAYEDHPIHIGQGQTISQPYMAACMTELLELTPNDRVLEIGTGSGYQAAILAELAAEVISIERQPVLAESAQARLQEFGYGNVTVLHGDGTLGYFEKAPYDAILVTAGSPEIPPALQSQLAEGGRLICPTGGRDYQRLTKLIRKGSSYLRSESISCVFVPLIGEAGWPENLPPHHLA